MDTYVYTGMETVERDRNKERDSVEKIFKKRLKKKWRYKVRDIAKVRKRYLYRE